MMSLEFEIPMVSMILILLLFFIYILKPKVKLIENKYYLIILIFSLIETALGFIAHLLCAIKGFDYVVANYYTFFNILNKFIGLSFIGIFCYMLVYILAISYKDFKKKVKMINITSIIFLLSCFALLCFTNIELVEVGNVTNVRGPTIMISYAVVAVLLLLNLIITLCNAKKID